MSSWKRNQPVAALRRASLFVYDVDGAPAAATTLFTGTNELLVDKGDGNYVAPGGSLSNTTRPAIVSDTIDSLNTGTNIITAAAHGMTSGLGPIQFTSTLTLPGGINALTDYYVGVLSANTFQIFPTRADMLAGTNVVDITTAGSGTITFASVAGTTAINDGNFIYTASQAEIDYRGTYFGIRIAKTNYRDLVHIVPLEEETQQHTGTIASATSTTATLDAAASATNDLYTDAVIVIVGGTGKGQSNTIVDYVGSTKVATLAHSWAITPDSTSQFVIIPAPASGNASTIASAVWAELSEGSMTYGDAMRALVSLIGCKVTDFTTGTFVFKSVNGAKTRWTVTVDQTGRLTATPGDLTP